MAQSTVSRYEGINHWSFTRLSLLKIPNNVSLYSHVVVEGEDWKILAWKQFGNPQYYWILAEINKVINVNDALVPGSIVLIPDSSILDYLNG